MFGGRSNRSSRSHSVSSNKSRDDTENVDDIQPDTIADSQEDSDTYRHTDEDFTRHPSYRFTKGHPLGEAILKIIEDNTILARKTNVKAMQSKAEDFCTSFHNAIRLERGITGNQLSQCVSDVEQSLLQKELNSHKFNTSVEPPTVFSNVPIITSTQKLNEIQKVFPKPSRFSGTNKEGHMGVVEFLNSLKAAQNQCTLTESEFIDRILAASTGPAHDLIQEWKASGMDTSAIFHNLLLNYDKRISAEDARNQLMGFVANKSQDLASVEAHIIKLVGRAASAMPPGESRKAYYNLEGATALIRALPSNSNLTASNLFSSITTRQGRPCTLHELSQGLNMYRPNIDKDIKQNGVDNYKNKKYLGNQSSYRPNRKFTSFGVETNGKRNTYNKNTDVSYTPKPKNSNFGRTGSNKAPFQQRNSNTKGRPWSQNNNHKTQLNGNKRQPNAAQAKTRCILCGYTNHSATGCRNMRDNSGNIIEIIPTQGCCEKCPQFIKNRLHHPEDACPFRNGGVFDRRNKSRN